jgi:hypothetical protein
VPTPNGVVSKAVRADAAAEVVADELRHQHLLRRELSIRITAKSAIVTQSHGIPRRSGRRGDLAPSPSCSARRARPDEPEQASPIATNDSASSANTGPRIPSAA